MDKITTVGLDLAKQVMAVRAIEACGGAHHWARELTRQGPQRQCQCKRGTKFTPHDCATGEGDNRSDRRLQI